MPITLDELVAKLTKRPLPALAVTVQRVKQLLDDPNTSNQDLQAVIGLDPGFTLEIYRRFWSASGDRRGPVSNIAHAISLLGPAVVKDAANVLPVLDKTLPESTQSGIYHCYSRAIHAAIYAQEIGEQRGDKNPDEMGHAALLYNCAEMALWTYAGKAMQKINIMVIKGADYGSASRSTLGFTLEELTAELARVWHICPLITEIMERAWHSQSRPMAVVLASAMARASSMGWYSSETNDLFEFLADFRRQSKERIVAHFHSQAADIARKLLGIPLPTSIFSLLQQIPEPVSEPSVTEKKADTKPAAKKAAKITAAQPAKQPQRPAKTVPQRESEKPPQAKSPVPPVQKVTPEPVPKPVQKAVAQILDKVVKEPVTEPTPPVVKPQPEKPSSPTMPPATPEPSPEPAAKGQEMEEQQVAAKPQREKPPTPITPTPTSKQEPKPAVESQRKVKKRVLVALPNEWKEVLVKFMRNLRDELGLKRIMFAMLSPDQKQAGVSHLIGADTNSRLRRFSINVEEKNLFNILLSRQQGFWLKPDNQEKFLPMIPEEVVGSMDTSGFFCMSIFVRNKPVGFIYADGKKAMNEECYTQFKQLCASLGSDLRRTKQ